MAHAYNVIDADGHILEPLDLWDKYIDPEFRERRPRFTIDENGKERLTVEGKLLGTPRGIVIPRREAPGNGRRRNGVLRLALTKGGVQPRFAASRLSSLGAAKIEERAYFQRQEAATELPGINGYGGGRTRGRGARPPRSARTGNDPVLTRRERLRASTAASRQLELHLSRNHAAAR